MRVLEYAGTNLGSSTPNHEQVVPITVFVALLCLCLVVGHLLEDNRWFNESIAAIFIVLYISIIFPFQQYLSIYLLISIYVQEKKDYSFCVCTIDNRVILIYFVALID